ncbi:hypothetical protein [Pelagicoccus mobilis]|uniref:Uncharacterized protein n=1 Tax=Pelagicoccus mobilis TaxID=415221 RepID=A0A934VR13_9BACT|nr:hypothetical protein [Pelagicoccus mobilis]MBK1878917.1 hypothetical protein [Pelagicoccus mobilis]
MNPLASLETLPPAKPGMDWRALNRYRKEDRGAAFYLTCLQYAQHLWQQRLPARSILCLDRAWGADLQGDEAVLKEWPLPYAALVDILKAAPDGAFLGNPRVHFQHYADRLGEPRREQRKWRAWACWDLTRATLPQLPGDPRHKVDYPSHPEISEQLALHGHPAEVELWLSTYPPR